MLSVAEMQNLLKSRERKQMIGIGGDIFNDIFNPLLHIGKSREKCNHGDYCAEEYFPCRNVSLMDFKV